MNAAVELYDFLGMDPPARENRGVPVSTIRVHNGTAAAELDSLYDKTDARGTYPIYNPHDLMDATAAALLAVNTPEAIRWAHAVYELINGESA